MDDSSFFASFTFVALLSAVVCGVAGYLILDRVDRGDVGGALGFFLGPIGLVIAWVMRDNGLRDEEERKRIRANHSAEAPVGFGRRTPMPPPPASPSGSLSSDVEALERLAALKERGHITQEEFDYKKRQVLGLEPAASPRPEAHPPRRRFR
ncbi:MAG TPA: SHOCT domain-containing protein [Acidobacteriaceae bacterium]|nr:SHOCT domain-containing protein [Acidobacteriaceae bacterium]